MGRIARLEKEVADLKSALASLTFVSDAPTVQVMVPVPELDANSNPTGNIVTGYLQIKTGPTSGEIRLAGKKAVLTMK